MIVADWLGRQTLIEWLILIIYFMGRKVHQSADLDRFQTSHSCHFEFSSNEQKPTSHFVQMAIKTNQIFHCLNIPQMSCSTLKSEEKRPLC